jgi:hypothetical protein
MPLWHCSILNPSVVFQGNESNLSVVLYFGLVNAYDKSYCGTSVQSVLLWYSTLLQYHEFNLSAPKIACFKVIVSQIDIIYT